MYLWPWSCWYIAVEKEMILLSARTVRLSVQRDDGKWRCLKWTRNHFLLHHHTTMSLEMGVKKTRLILPEDFLVLLLGLGDPGLRWVFSGPDLLPNILTVPSATGNMKLSPFIGVSTSFALGLWACSSNASICPIPQCLRPKCLLSTYPPRLYAYPRNFPGKTFGPNWRSRDRSLA